MLSDHFPVPSRDSRDEKLWGLLPALDSPYAYDSLSKQETAALHEALADGFGEVLVRGSHSLPIPPAVRRKAGLLEHSFFVDSLYDADNWEDVFWGRRTDEDEPPAPGEVFPVGFNQRRLRVYFINQLERFCFERTKDHERYRKEKKLPPLDPAEDRWIFENDARQMVYQKPWYEYHALHFFYFIDESTRAMEKFPGLGFITISSFAGQLGRLIEQYYWRFRFEALALTGRGARKGASAGGKAKAALHQSERSTWQMLALQTWAGRPQLSKTAVAEIIRKRLGMGRTAKHIARYIRHP